MSFTFGSDPEFMLTHHDELKSAIGILPKKENATVKNGNGYYFDNVLAEIAVKPAKSKDEALANVRDALTGLARLVSPGKFVIRASANYPKKELNCPDAKIAGCNPEWNVYTLQMVFPPDEDVDLQDGFYQFKGPFRSAGGHIHLGSERLLDPTEMFSVVRMMDLFVGIPSIFLDTDETSKERRRIYGHAGSHRSPEYGVEYRALGNFWFSSPELVALMYDLSAFTLKFVEQKLHERFWSVNEDLLDDDDPSIAYKCFGYDLKLLLKAINNCDRKQAEKFMMFVSNYLPTKLVAEIDRLSGRPLPDPYEAWNLS